MKAHLTGALAICLLSVSVVEGQTISEQLQRAIYTQSMLGALDGAIRMYQQIIASSPSKSELRTQAERLLATAEAYRRSDGTGPRALGEVWSSSKYWHRRTEITFEVPSGWNVQGTHPSSDNGEQVDISIPYPDSSKLPAQMSVWMIKFPVAIDEATIEQQLDNAPLDKMRQRAQDGHDDWRLREVNGRVSGRMTYGGKPGVSALADYRANGRAMVEMMVWVVTNRSRAFFTLRMAAEDFYDGLLVTFLNVVYSAKVP
jgi:hypothetical protein